MAIFPGGNQKVPAPTTLKTINANANRGGKVMNERLRDYAGSPRPKPATGNVTAKAKAISTGGNDASAVNKAKRQTRRVEGQPPMEGTPNQAYSPMAVKGY